MSNEEVTDAMEMIKNQCYECSSNNTIVRPGELECLNCSGCFVHGDLE